MRLFDDEERINRIFEEFQKVDEFYDEFKLEFNANILSLIRIDYPDFEEDELYKRLIEQYALTVLSVTQTVLDKDQTYPDYRKQEDLAAMQTYYAKAVALTSNKDLAQKIHLSIKGILVKYYPQIADLSAVGFRLLELNLSLFNMEFTASFNNLTTK